MLNRQNTRDFYTLCMDPTNFQSVTLQSRQATNQAQTLNYVLPRARPRPLDKSEVNPLLTAQKMVWQIWQDSLDGATPVPPAPGPCPNPKAADIITDSNGTNWVVKRVENTLCQDGSTGNVWNCETLRSAAAP